MSDPSLLIIVCLLLALLVRVFWREILNLVLICCLTVLFAGLFFGVVGVFSVLPPG
jgi:hypothetical protein